MWYRKVFRLSVLTVRYGFGRVSQTASSHANQGINSWIFRNSIDAFIQLRDRRMLLGLREGACMMG